MKIAPLRVLVPTLCLVLMSSCGGGGGGSAAFYAGLWRFLGVKVVDTCPAGGGLPQTADIELTVNQDGDRIVAQSGSIVFEGSVDEEADGFTVTALRGNSCGGRTAYAYAFGDASDGEADTGLAIIQRCANGSECRGGYSGTSTRQNSRSDRGDGASLDELAQSLLDSTAHGGNPATSQDIEEAAAQEAYDINLK